MSGTIYTEIIEEWQQAALKAFRALTDEQLDTYIRSCRHGNGYILVPGMAPVILQEMKRRDPSGTRKWG